MMEARWETSLREWIIKHSMLLGMIALSVLGVYLRYACWPISMGDLKFLNSAWYEALTNGGIKAVLEPSLQFNYSPIHLYLWYLFSLLLPNTDAIIVLKVASVVFELFLSATALLLLWRVLPAGKNRKVHFLIGFALMAFNPISILNAAAWGQTDAIYALFSVLAVLFYLDKKTIWALVMLGVSFAFKMQAIFILPMFIVLYFIGNKRIPLVAFFLVPIIWILSGVPMLFVGESPFYAVEVYLGQTAIYAVPTFNCPNIYALMGDFITERGWMTDLFTKAGMVFTVGIIGTMAVFLISQKKQLNSCTVLLLSAWFIIACVFFLPRMHERYAFVGELLLLVWVVATKKPYRYLYYFGTMLATLSAYAEYFVDVPFFPLQIGGFINLIVFIGLTYEVYKETKTNPQLAVRDA